MKKKMGHTSSRLRNKNTIQWLIILTIVMAIAGCGFRLRGQNILPPNIHCIKLNSPRPYGDFELTMRRSLIRLGVNVTRTEQAPLVLNINSSGLIADVPTIGGSNQARVYVYYYQVNFSVLDACNNVIIPPKCVITSKSLIVNAGTALEATNQVAILTQEMEIEVAHMIINILNSPQVACALGH